MEKLNYQLVDKKATIEGLISGEISISELSNIYVLDIENQEVSTLSSVETMFIFESINDPNVLFVQGVDSENNDIDDDFADEEDYVPIKKNRKSR